MATVDLERLVVQLSADVTRYERSLARATGTAINRTRQIEQRFNRMQSTIGASFAGIAGTATRAFAIIAGARGLQTLTDSATRIDNALKVAGLSGEELERVYSSLRDSAIRNAAPLSSLVQLYGRVALVQRELGVSSQELTQFSDGVALALRIGGRTSQEASGALLQLSQALGEGIVRAQEFNSIIEGAPVILQAAAAGIQQAGGSVAKLRQIMLAGNLSSKALFDGFLAGAPLLEGRVAGSVFTLEQSFENLYTALLNAARQFNTATGASETLARGLGQLGEAIASVDVAGFIQKIQEAKRTLDDFLNSAGNAGPFDDLNRALGVVNEDGSIVNPDFTNASNRVSALEQEIENLQAAIRSNTELGFDNLDALNRIAEVRVALQQARRELSNFTPTVEALTIVPGQGIRPVGGTVQRPQQGPTRTEEQRREQEARNERLRAQAIDIDQAQYRPTGQKEKKDRKERLDDLAREIQRIRERTENLNAETQAQSELNPLVNDYGRTLTFVRARQDLLNAALNAGKEITPELSAEIDRLAGAYADSSVAAERLAESQEKIRERQEEILNVQKEVTRGLVDDLIEGKSAADAFAGALKRIASALLDSAFNSFFSSTSSGGGGGFTGLIRGLGSLFGFERGGYTGSGGRSQPAGIVHRGEYVIPKNVVDSVGLRNIERLFTGYQNGGYVNPGLASARAASSIPTSSGGAAVTYAPVIDARGADVEAVARLERIIETDRRNFSARVQNAVRGARNSNVKGF